MRHGELVSLLIVMAVAPGACGDGSSDHELFADDAYAEGRYGDALVEYHLALAGNADNAGLHLKAGAAALRAGDLVTAAAEFTTAGLGVEEGRRDDPAAGLMRVARSAVERDDRAALAAALQGLERIAPETVLSGLAAEAVSVLGELPQGKDALTVLLHAAAAAPDTRGQDSLMLEYGRILQRTGRCADAAVVFESLVRRERTPVVTASARAGLVACALQLGRGALDAGRPTTAERWFELAASRAGESPSGRVAYLGLGDVRFALGDALGAIEAYEQARAGASPGDSLYNIVARRLNRIASPPSAIP